MNLSNYIVQDIPNKVSVLGEIEQKVIITSITVNWQSPTNPKVGLPQIVVEYEILQSKDGQDVSSLLKNKIKPKTFNNDTKVYQRSFEQDTLFQPVVNPEYVEGETPEELKYLTIGAFDFIVGELVMKHPEYLVPFLKMYILDNYQDGWYESAN